MQVPSHDPTTHLRLRSWLEANNVSQSAFARELGIRASTMNAVATGRLSLAVRLRSEVERRTGIPARDWRTKAEVEREAGLAGVEEATREVPFAPGYFVSETGRVYHLSKRGFTALKPWKSKYPTAMFMVGSKQVGIRISRLVCTLFNGQQPDDERSFVCHRDDNPENNHYSNLYFGSHRENVADAVRNERYRGSMSNARARLVVALGAEGKTPTEIAKILGGVTVTTVTRILRGETWTHIEGDRVLNEREVLRWKILELAREGVKPSEIKKRLGIENEYHYQIIARARRAGLLSGGNVQRITADDVRAVNALYDAGFGGTEIAKRLHMCAMIVHDITKSRASVGDAAAE